MLLARKTAYTVVLDFIFCGRLTERIDSDRVNVWKKIKMIILQESNKAIGIAVSEWILLFGHTQSIFVQ